MDASSSGLFYGFSIFIHSTKNKFHCLIVFFFLFCFLMNLIFNIIPNNKNCALLRGTRYSDNVQGGHLPSIVINLDVI